MSLPTHVALIMDGNRRWARSHGWEAIRGHEYVVDNCIEPIVDRCIALGIPYLTLWAFSTENWERDKREIEGMMKLFRRAFEKKVEDLHRKGVRLRIVGDIDRFPEDIAQNARRWVEISKDNSTVTVSFALNYGGREEILGAVNSLLEKKMTGVVTDDSSLKEGIIQNSRFNFQKITSEEFERHLATAGMPDPDLIIRPGGQLRLSGFMPWQSVYAELYFTDVLMPEFGAEEFDIAIDEYQRRQRRFGR